MHTCMHNRLSFPVVWKSIMREMCISYNFFLENEETSSSNTGLIVGVTVAVVVVCAVVGGAIYWKIKK